jgi:hypothetical protein
MGMETVLPPKSDSEATLQIMKMDRLICSHGRKLRQRVQKENWLPFNTIAVCSTCTTRAVKGAAVVQSPAAVDGVFSHAPLRFRSSKGVSPSLFLLPQRWETKAISR